jgi:hypothetical protein
MKVNYIKHLSLAYQKIAESGDKLSSTDIAIYNALFQVWNSCNFKDELSINRADIMSLAKIGSNNTYLKSLNNLQTQGFIIYKPSHNPLKGSIVNLVNFCTSADKAVSLSCHSSGTTTEQTPAPLHKLYKLLNNKTIETIEANASLVDSMINVWIEEEKDKQRTDTSLLLETQKSNAELKKQKFEEFWTLYDKKRERKHCVNKFNKFSMATIEKILQAVPAYVKSTPDIRYRKNPESWLNGECWDDEIIVGTNNPQSADQDHNSKMGIRIKPDGTQEFIKSGCLWIDYFKYPLREKPTTRPDYPANYFEQELKAYNKNYTKEEIEQIYRLPKP